MSGIRLASACCALPVLLATALAACGGGTGASPASSTTLSRPSASGNADVLTREQIERIHATSMEQLITRRFNGLQVLKGDGAPVLRVRGTREPLIVLDDVPLAAIDIFWQLDPNDIEEIKVLRESGTAIYGVQGASGVIVVNTRKR